MKSSKILSLAVAICVMLCSLPFASAATFNDVDSTKYSWAVNEINSMASSGIIKGYEDGTFRPERTVTKLEALVLTARVLGVNNSENESVLDAAIEAYSEKIDKYELSYGNNEIAYLLIKNIISESELSSYIEKNIASEGMKRYEIAVLLTKALDAEKTVSQNVITSLEYSDAADIPAYAKKYVEYVTNNGLMNGMDNNNFSPNTDVTRAQAAVLLSKLIGMTDYTFQSGLVSSMDTASRIIKVKNSSSKSFDYTVNSSVLLRFEGAPITISDIATGYEAVITLKGDTLYAIDFVTPLLDDEIYGAVTSITTGSKPSIAVNVFEDDSAEATGRKESFPLADNCVILYGGDSSSLNSLKAGMYVRLTVKSGKITTVDAYDKTSTVSGRISDIQITPVCKLFVELTNGTEEEYLVTDDVTVTRNGSKATAADVVTGDTVGLTLTYGRVSKIVATSKSQTKNGIITQVIISVSPKLTLKIDGSEITYPVSNGCTFKIPGKADANFYDLRAGASAEVKIESDTIVEISTDVSDGITQISGTVASVNTSYAVIQLNYVDSASGNTVTEPVFVKSKATIIDITTGNALKISAINPGAKITAFGSRNSGVFEATTINVTTN